ncbi:MAG: ABC transporter substrate-binding protein [Bdellovibrionales bacterium]|nr:ABC transporter substrate-binding protein [Bdellovibrionales bacterium]
MVRRFCLVLLPCLLLVSCFKRDSSDSDGDNSPIAIGAFLSLSGTDASFSGSTKKGLELAIEQINSKGGVKGRRLKLIIKDDQGKPETAAQLVEALADQDNVVAIIGQAASQLSLAAAPIAQKKQVPMISPSSTNPRVTEAGDYVFRVCFIDPFQGYVMAKFARSHLKVDKVAILRDRKSEYSMGLAEYFSKTFLNLGGEVVAEEEFVSGDLDFRDQISHIRSQSPSAIFIPGYYTEVALIARQIRQMGLKAHLLGGDGWDSGKLFELARESVNGSYFSSHFTSESKEPQVKDFVELYRSKYKERPDGFAAMAFDATHILAEALRKAKVLSREEIRNKIAETKGFPGVTGAISLNSERNAEKPAVIFKIDGPVNRFVTTIAPQ